MTQNEKLALAVAAKTYLQRLSVTWTSPLSDANRVRATNQFALPVLTYPMWTQHGPLGEVRDIYRETRSSISENGGRHPLSSCAVIYFPREEEGRGLKSVKQEYKPIKIKAAIKPCDNPDPMMGAVRIFEERACENGFSSLVKDTHKFAEELGTSLNLVSPEPSCSSFQAPEKRIGGHQVRQHFKKAVGEKVGDQKWQGRLLWTRWENDQLSKRGCFSWLRTVPTIVTAHTFCASRDTRVSYGWCRLIQEYFCAV